MTLSATGGCAPVPGEVAQGEEGWGNFGQVFCTPVRRVIRRVGDGKRRFVEPLIGHEPLELDHHSIVVVRVVLYVGEAILWSLEVQAASG